MNASVLADYNNPDSFGSRMRARRMAPLVGLILKSHAERGRVRILDVGGREQYWKVLDKEFLLDRGVTITILNLPEDLAGEENDLFKYAVGDACNLPQYEDNAFDIVHSNSVIEHVGGWEKIKEFARETNRLAPRLFIQTPYYWFPVEPHFIKPLHHWLPKPIRARIWMRFTMGQRGKAANIDEAMHKIDDEPFLLDMKMFRFLYPDCAIISERFLLMRKSMIAFRDRAPNSP